MTLIPKLQIGLNLAFLVITAVPVVAQTQDAAENSSSKATVNVTSKDDARTAVSKNSASAPVLETASDVTSEVGRTDRPKSDEAVTTPVESTHIKTVAAIPKPQGSTTTDEWEFQVTPYLWLAGLHGTTGTGTRTTQVDESFGDIFDLLNFALMGTFEARKGKFVSVTDLQYISLSDDRATPGPLFSAVKLDVKSFIFQPDIGYRFYDNPAKGAFVDVLGGIRVWHLKTRLTFSPGILQGVQDEASRSWVDAVGGLRGQVYLSEKVFLTGKFDLGGGGSKFTWQVFGGGGYNINKKIALLFGYRDLDVNYDKNNFVYDMSQRGPILGVGFKF